jgi:hypothetical protein
MNKSMPNTNVVTSDSIWISCEDLEGNTKKYDFAIVDFETVGNDALAFAKRFKLCKVIGVTSNVNILAKATNRPIFYRLFYKPVEVDGIVNFLVLQNRIKNANKSNSISKKSALKTLIELGFKVNQNGTHFLADCIGICVNKKIFKLKEIYRELGEQIGVSCEIISWSINYAICQANTDSNIDKLYRFFNIYDNRKVTAKTIIEFFVRSN